RSVYDEQQIDMILQMLSENRTERPSLEEIASVFPETLFERSGINKPKDYFAGIEKEKVAAPPLLRKIQRVFQKYGGIQTSVATFFEMLRTGASCWLFSRPLNVTVSSLNIQ
ncbi:MAG: hypothetical protein V4489_08655, partial [Chlamydiota bacterium]